jgi:hypothetical protein
LFIAGKVDENFEAISKTKTFFIAAMELEELVPIFFWILCLEE